MGSPFLCLHALVRSSVGLTSRSLLGVSPLPPGLEESRVCARDQTKIFDVKELTCKIFRTKHLAHVVLIFEGHTRRVMLTY